MADPVTAFIAEELGGYWLAAEAASAIVTAVEVVATVATVYDARESQRKQRDAAQAAYLASLKDRYVMTRSTTAPRQFVLGRQRVSGPLAYIGSYGADREHLVFAVIFAAHECDGIEAIYFDDEQVTIDGTGGNATSGNVLSVNRHEQFTLTAAGGTFNITSAPATGSVSAFVDYGTTRVTLGVSVAGQAVTVSGGMAVQAGTLTIQYQPAQSPFANTQLISTTETFGLDASGNGSITLSHTPIGGVLVVGVSASWPSDEGYQTDIGGSVTVSGSTVTVTGSPVVSGSAIATYSYQVGAASKARVRTYLGAPGQAADAGMVANLPGIWDSSHTMSGMCYAVVELDYSTDAFPTGIPNISALVRGAKCYDPRTGATAWTRNPPLLMRYVATQPMLGNQDVSAIDDAAVASAANVCDASTAYVVNGQTYVRPLYTADTLVKSGTRAKDILDDLARAMNGRWAFPAGILRLRAGAYQAPLQSLDETWLTDRQAVQVQTAANRADIINVYTGRFVDEQRDYVEQQFPRVEADAYITADGRELPQDVALNAVSFVGQAQQVLACELRDARQGLRIVLTCNMRAFCVELFDTLNVSLSRFGWRNKVFEVLDRIWTLDGGIQLTLKETDPSIWALGTTFSAADPAPNTLFPSPWSVPAITGISTASGTAQLLLQADGTVQSRILVSFDPIADALVAWGGGVELRYGVLGFPESMWTTIVADNPGASQAYISNVRDGWIYAVKLRAFNGLVKGPWSDIYTRQVTGKTAPPSNVTGFIVTQIPTGLRFSWNAIADADVAEYEVHEETSWHDGTAALWRGAATYFEMSWPSAGLHTYQIKARDTSGNLSAAAASTTAAVDGSGLINTNQLGGSSVAELLTLSGYLFWSTYI